MDRVTDATARVALVDQESGAAARSGRIAPAGWKKCWTAYVRLMVLQFGTQVRRSFPSEIVCPSRAHVGSKGCLLKIGCRFEVQCNVVFQPIATPSPLPRRKVAGLMRSDMLRVLAMEAVGAKQRSVSCTVYRKAMKCCCNMRVHVHVCDRVLCSSGGRCDATVASFLLPQ